MACVQTKQKKKIIIPTMCEPELKNSCVNV